MEALKNFFKSIWGGFLTLFAAYFLINLVCILAGWPCVWTLPIVVLLGVWSIKRLFPEKIKAGEKAATLWWYFALFAGSFGAVALCLRTTLMRMYFEAHVLEGPLWLAFMRVFFPPIIVVIVLIALALPGGKRWPAKGWLVACLVLCGLGFAFPGLMEPLDRGLYLSSLDWQSTLEISNARKAEELGTYVLCLNGTQLYRDKNSSGGVNIEMDPNSWFEPGTYLEVKDVNPVDSEGREFRGARSKQFIKVIDDKGGEMYVLLDKNVELMKGNAIGDGYFLIPTNRNSLLLYVDYAGGRPIIVMRNWDKPVSFLYHGDSCCASFTMGSGGYSAITDGEVAGPVKNRPLTIFAEQGTVLEFKY